MNTNTQQQPKSKKCYETHKNCVDHCLYEQQTGEGNAPREYSGSGDEWASKLWKAYNKGCDHRAYNFAGEHVGGKSYQWEQWSEDERIAYLRGYNGQFISSEHQKTKPQ